VIERTCKYLYTPSLAAYKRLSFAKPKRLKCLLCLQWVRPDDQQGPYISKPRSSTTFGRHALQRHFRWIGVRLFDKLYQLVWVYEFRTPGTFFWILLCKLVQSAVHFGDEQSIIHQFNQRQLWRPSQHQSRFRPTLRTLVMNSAVSVF